MIFLKKLIGYLKRKIDDICNSIPYAFSIFAPLDLNKFGVNFTTILNYTFVRSRSHKHLKKRSKRPDYSIFSFLEMLMRSFVDNLSRSIIPKNLSFSVTGSIR